MKTTRRFASLLLLALTSACAADAEPEAYSGLDATRASGDPMDEVCAFGHQIAYDPTGTLLCDSAGPWNGEVLFPGAGVPSALTHYCRYTYGAATEQDVDDLDSWLDTTYGVDVEIGTDCRAVTPEGSASQTALGPGLSQYFDWYSGRVVPDDIQSVYPNAVARRVDVAVVDTAPHEITVHPNSDHGPIVASLINSFVCPPPSLSCAIEVETFLGLPRTATSRQVNSMKGGTLGLQSDLARGVFNAVENHSSSGAENLVINLSVAWEPKVFHGAEEISKLTPPVRAVYDALRHARCSGALIVAAAGNSQGLDCEEGAMAPALWETHPAPTTSECSDDFEIENWSERVGYAPLVHGVGGLRDDSAKVPNGREFGMPKLAAAASHVFVPKGPGMAEDEVRTGTSMSTAVATATASLIWSYRPNLSPSQVMNFLYNSGNPTSFTADFGLNGQQSAVKRVNACRAVASACTKGCGPKIGSLACGAPQPVGPSDFAAALALAPHTTDQYTTEFETPFECLNACGAPYYFYPAADDDRDCPEMLRDPWDKLTSPQPIFAGCTECELEFHANTSSTARLNVDDDYDGVEILAVDIELSGENGAAKTIALSESDLASVLVGKPALTSDELRKYDISLPATGFVPVTANVLITFAGGEQTKDPLIITP